MTDFIYGRDINQWIEDNIVNSVPFDFFLIQRCQQSLLLFPKIDINNFFCNNCIYAIKMNKINVKVEHMEIQYSNLKRKTCQPKDCCIVKKFKKV